MKKEPIVYFPQDPEILQKRDVSVGEELRIGKPSSGYYQHLNHSLNYNSHRLTDLKELLKLEGNTVKITSILTMRSGAKIAVLHKKDGTHFSSNIEKIFASLNKAMDSEELNFY